ncbi:MAG: tRNA epoxyqueuosine(34) reductase QueG [Chloroflexota bacterium]
MPIQKTLTQAVKDEAQRLGFQLVGVTTPDPPPHVDVYESWLDNGHHAGMGWMATERARQRRADPLLILPECRSILVLGVRYPPSPLPSPSTPSRSIPEGVLPMGEWRRGEGRVASYAWGNDYHDVLPKRLRELVAFIEKQVGQPVLNRWYTDTGPILERELAQRAGLGWIGKNTCLINPKMGSYFLLAEIVLGIALEPDVPTTADHCGDCTRCLDSCPTACIMPDRTIDANRCISYLTIEKKGSIPEDLRPRMGDWIFGCDICQQVCPWNQKFAAPQWDPAFSPRLGLPPPSLEDELALTPQEFNRKFKGSPVKRAKRRGYLRNVAVALGNSGDPAAIPALIQALTDPEPVVRGHAAWALARIGSKQAVQALQEAEKSEDDPEVLAEIRAAREA